MWAKGMMQIHGAECRYWIKHFDEPSEEYGIDGGRISKLEIRKDGVCTLNYDRVWDIMPQDEITQKALEAIKKEWNLGGKSHENKLQRNR